MDDKERLERAQEALGYTFQNPELLSQSLRHPSSTDQIINHFAVIHSCCCFTFNWSTMFG